MSKIGKKIITVPQGTTIEIRDHEVTVRGPKGELKKDLALDGFSVTQEASTAHVVPPSQLNKRTRSLWGTFGSILQWMVQGVNTPFSKALEFNGIGFRAEVSGTHLVLNVGFSHPVKLEIPQHISVVVAKNIITVSGLNKEQVGLFAAKIRKVKKVEPYKGTGIKYVGEIVRKKAGKKMGGAAG